MTLKSSADKEASQVSKAGSSGMIIRGMTFYKSEPDPMVADDGEPGENCESNLSVTLSGIKATKTIEKCLFGMYNYINLFSSGCVVAVRDGHRSFAGSQLTNSRNLIVFQLCF